VATWAISQVVVVVLCRQDKLDNVIDGGLRSPTQVHGVATCGNVFDAVDDGQGRWLLLYRLQPFGWFIERHLGRGWTGAGISSWGRCEAVRLDDSPGTKVLELILESYGLATATPCESSN